MRGSSLPGLGQDRWRFRLMPQELIFGALLLCCWVRFVLGPGPLSLDALLYLGLLGADAVLIARHQLRPGRLSGYLRLGFHPLVFNVVYFQFATGIPHLAPAWKDLSL